MTAFYYATRLYFKDYTFIENYVDDFGVEHSIVPPFRPNVDRYIKENLHLQERVCSLEHQNQYLLQGLHIQQQAYTTQLLVNLRQLENLKKSLNNKQQTPKQTQPQHPIMKMFSSLSVEDLPETPRDAVEVSEVEKSVKENNLFAKTQQQQQQQQQQQNNFIQMLSTMSNIHPQRPKAETPWGAIKVADLEKATPIRRGRRQVA